MTINSFPKALFILMAACALGWGETRDYLFISGHQDTQGPQIDSVEQRIAESVKPSDSGSYELQLQDKHGIVGRNYFFMPSAQGKGEVFTQPGEEGAPDRQAVELALANFLVQVPLDRSFQADQAQLSIWKDGKKIAEFRLGGIPLQVFSVKTNRMSHDTAPVKAVQKTSLLRIYLPWILGGLVVLFLIYFVMKAIA